MSNKIYQSTVKYIGDFANDALTDGMLITFKEGVSSDLADYCFIHSHDKLLNDLEVGQTLELGGYSYKISAVGEVATTNLRELGHITLRFDGAHSAELPGSVHLVGDVPSKFGVGDTITILSK